MQLLLWQCVLRGAAGAAHLSMKEIVAAIKEATSS
jgi:hypothetical protein